MKKNFLTPVIESKAVTAVTKYCKEHKSTLLAGGTIGFSLGTTAIVFRNSPLIHQIIWDTKESLEYANNEEEKKSIYKAAIKALVPLVSPIIIFQAGTIACTIITKKDSDKKDARIAELSSAVAVATQVIEEYNQFQKEAEAQLGEKKLQKVRENITANSGEVVVENVELAPGEIIFRDHYCGHVFKGTKDLVELACERLAAEIKDNDYAVLNGDYYHTLGLPEDTELGDKFGYYAENDRLYIRPSFINKDIYVNGTLMPGYEVWLNPSPDYIDC